MKNLKLKSLWCVNQFCTLYTHGQFLDFGVCGQENIKQHLITPLVYIFRGLGHPLYLRDLVLYIACELYSEISFGIK